MKKILTYSVALTILALVTIGGTYAMFTATVSYTGEIDTKTHQVKIIYDGAEEISGHIELVTKKDEGFKRKISIAIDDDSVDTVGNIYIYIDEISEGFASPALKWEIYKIENGTEEHIKDGTFEDYSSGDKIYMIENLTLTQDIQQFMVYIWLNGYEAGNEVRNSTLRGYIGAESGIVSGIMENKN